MSENIFKLKYLCFKTRQDSPAGNRPCAKFTRFSYSLKFEFFLEQTSGKQNSVKTLAS